MLAKRVNRIGMSPTLRISGAAKALRADGVDVVDLSIGEPDFPTPQHVKDAAKRALDDNQTGYTANDGIPQLKRAICNKLQRENNLSYELDQVLVSPGAKFSLYLAIAALVDRDQDVIIPAPYWVSYPEQVRVAEANPVIVPTREEDGFRLTPQKLASVLTCNTKMLILNYPSNPTGATYSREQLAGLGEVCEREGIWILADEIYEKLIYDGHQHTSIASISPALQKRTILINGLSKAYSMTGWRIGYAAGPRQVIQAMAKVQSHSTSNATSIAQWAGVAAIEGPQGDVARMAGEFARRRNFLIYKVRAIDGISCDEPKGAFYLFPNVANYYDRQIDGSPIRNSYGLAYYLLKYAHVAVVPGGAFGAPDHLRLSYSSSMDRLEEGMTRITEALGRLERPRGTRRLVLDNVRTKVDRLVETEITGSAETCDRLVADANRTISDEDYYEWNASIGGIVVQLRTNSPHLNEFWMENWYPAQLETDLEPHGIIYGVKGLAGRQAGALYHPDSRTGFAVNTAFYGQLRSLAIGLVADIAERMSGVHVVRAAAVDIGGRGLLLMGSAGSGMSGQLWRLLGHEGVRLVSTDTVFLRYVGGEALADLVERKLYMKTKWVSKEPRLAPLFDRSHLENAVTEEHQNDLCEGGDDCPVTRGMGVCYQASNESRAMLDPYWLGGAKGHSKRVSVHQVAIFRREPTGQAVQAILPTEAIAMLQHASVPRSSGGSQTVPWLNDYLLDTSAQRMDAQRRLFGKLFAIASPVAVNTAYASAGEITPQLLDLVRR